MRTRVIFFAALLAVLPSALAQQPIDQAAALEKVKQEIQAGQKKYFVPGVSIAIIKDDKVVLLTGLGYRDLSAKKPVTADTLFAIGSTTKAFTSMLTAMAVDEGKLKFTDSPKKYLPYFRMSDPDTDAKITISDLLSHRSGLPRTDLIMVAGDLSSEDLIWNVTRAKPTAKLGEKWQYQNIMFVAAGEILHAVNKDPWSAQVKSRILDPLGMTHTNMSVPQTIADPDHSLGYAGTPDYRALPMRALDSAGPAGAINSSAKDMAEWIRFLLRGGEANGKQLVSKENYAELFKPRISVFGNLSYGYGWMLDDWNGHKVYQHGGNIDGFNAQVGLMPDQHLGVVVLTNVSGSPLSSETMQGVWKNLVGEPASTTKIVALENPDQEVGTYHLEIAKLDFVVTHEGNKLFVKPSGQPKMELQPLGDRRYKVAPPAPDQVFMSFRPEKDNLKVTEAELEQAGAKFTMKAPKAYEPPITVDALMEKAVAAAGGLSNLRKVKTLSYRYLYDMESQGVKASGVITKMAPNTQADLAVLSASGRRLGWYRLAYDGKRAVEEASFSPTEEKGGTELADIALDSAMFQELNWHELFPSIQITGTEKVSGEEAFVVEKKPAVGSKVVDYISTTTFRLLKRISGSGAAKVTDVYKDYKEVQGVQIPMTVVRDTILGGVGTLTVMDLQINGTIDRALLSTGPPAK
jgi:CubicO group peptidase (beta-lactamase class C family)